MQRIKFLSICLLLASISFGQTFKQTFITTDLDNFRTAYRKMSATQDTLLQKQYLHDIFLQPGTAGLRDFRQRRNYTETQYLEAIRQYPRFWKSIQPGTKSVKKQFARIEKAVQNLQRLYPALKPVPIYFTMGVFRSNGTISPDKVMIGCEMALADKSVDVSELPPDTRAFYERYTPIDDLIFLCAHEYVHTQQKPLVDNLLSYCIYEGIPEFIAELATNRKPYLSAIAHGEKHYEQVRNQFEKDLYIPFRTFNWLWSNRQIMGERDMGYAVGYQMAKRYYEKAPDKQVAIREMIELDYADEAQIERYVDASGYLSKPIAQLYRDFENVRPFITHTSGVENGSKTVKPGLQGITVHFSRPLNGHNTGVDYGPLGEMAFPEVKQRVWSEDRLSWTLRVELAPNKHYQILISNNFRDENDIPLKPLLIEFQTTE
ncbi:MAG: hypothetical protein SFV22_06605 [Saprospiraceae bacterium]|nr:hypothetical protein [Saprospiraceae bacterium]